MICSKLDYLLSHPLKAPNDSYLGASEVLSCFMRHDDGKFKYNFLNTKFYSDLGITKLEYILNSQKWPMRDNEHIPTTIWQHKLNLYIPKNISYSTVLLYIGGGYNRDKEGEGEFSLPKEMLDYVKIAEHNKAVVAELQDVPNQFLSVGGNQLKEDQILAYTYKLVMEDFKTNAQLAGHLPMAKAVVKAMDAIEEILNQSFEISIANFVLTGASKRGWAVWLASLEDERVSAIIPIVIDVLNTQKSINHICTIYKDGCPYALKDYEKYGITQMINTYNFTLLMQIEDPYSYLSNEYDDKYLKALSIPKYIINSAGDDFFAPDSSKWYFQNLPGDNHIRYMPNTLHYMGGSAISDSTNAISILNQAIDSYFNFIINNLQLPKVFWKLSASQIEVASSVIPIKAILWTLNNVEDRDFRFLNSYSPSHLWFKEFVQSHFSSKLCDRCYVEEIITFNCQENQICEISAPLPIPSKGWLASFVELHYNINDHEFVVTTEVNIGCYN